MSLLSSIAYGVCVCELIPPRPPPCLASIRGLFSFASTTLILSLYNVNARHISVPNVVVGMALGVGGLVQLLAGMWEFACGNTFGATVREFPPSHPLAGADILLLFLFFL